MSLQGIFKVANLPSEDLLKFYEGKKNDLIYSEILPVEIPDVAGEWKLYSASRNADFFKSLQVSELKEVHFLIAIFILFVGGVCFYLVHKSNNRRERLEVLVNKVNDAVKEMRSSSKELESISTSLSSETNEQAASIQETSASLVEVNSMISNNNDATQTIVSKSKNNLKFVESGKDVINHLNTSIEDIAKGNNLLLNQLNHSNVEISQILEIINEVESKTKVINDIVFQTKLLSFNASVEAARAGESGKGFAVVAEKVGNLAALSGNSALEISSILDKSVQKISEIVKNSKNSSASIMEENKKSINNGLLALGECEKVFSEIFENINQSTNLINEISVASKEQASGVTQISQAVTQLDQSTHNISRNASLTAKSSSILASEILKLEQLSKDLYELMKS